MKKTRWISFLGGENLLYTLITLILIAVAFMLFNQIDYIFTPLFVIVSNILMPLVIALLLYYLFDPVIDFLEKHGIKRLYGVALLFIAIVGLVVFGIIALYPLLREQAISLVENFPDFVDSILNTVTGWISSMPFGEDIGSLISEGEDLLDQIPENISDFLPGGWGRISNIAASVTSFVVTLVTFPIILFFMLKDEQKFFKSALTIMPPKWREHTLRVSSEVNTQVGSYIKGQLIIAGSIGVMMFIGFTIIGLEYSGILAIIASFTSIIPFLGPTLAIIPALVIALTDSWWMVLQLGLVWAVVQFIDGNLIEPNVMGRQLNVHPLTIVIVLLVMGDLLGLFGLILGVPIYAILKVIVVHFFQQFKKRYNKYYGDVAGDYEVKPIEEAISGSKKPDSQMMRNIKIAKLKRQKAKEHIEQENDESE